MPDFRTYSGGCHCGAVRFEAATDPGQAIACNCSHCAKHGLWLTFVQPDAFKLLAGDAELVDYQFNKHVIHHLFCRSCGVEPFARGTGRDGKPAVAINVRCLDGINIAELSPRPVDGRSF